MICEISLGKSFFHAISYCLEDKRTLSEEQKISLSRRDGLQHKDRAEVLAYNQCFGNKQELADQFNDVRHLSKRVEKPVLHLMLRLAPGEKLSRGQWIEIAGEMAREMGVENNQYLVVEHKDTAQQHIHIIANRVGYNGKAATTSNNFYKMDRLCRRLEKEYQLTEVLSPKQFLPKEMRQLPRHDIRKEKMKTDIQRSLRWAKNYEDFARRMHALGYQVIKGRGIAFVDDKKMRVKGSELGYSLATIEKRLQQKLTPEITTEKISFTQQQQRAALQTPSTSRGNTLIQKRIRQKLKAVQPKDQQAGETLRKAAGDLLKKMMQPEYVPDNDPDPQFLDWPYKKKKKKQKPRLR